MTSQDADALLRRLESDPEAVRRRFLYEFRREEEVREQMLRIPPPKGIQKTALQLCSEYREALICCGELERRFAEILRRSSKMEDDQRSELKFDFNDRLEYIKGTFDECAGNLEAEIQERQEAYSRDEKRLAAHEIARTVTDAEKTVAEAKADLAVLLEWTKNLPEQVPDASTIQPSPPQ